MAACGLRSRSLPSWASWRAIADPGRPAWLWSELRVDWKNHDLRTVAPTLMRGVVDALGLERTHVIGHSIGGVWALRLAQDHASRVGKIGILGASPVLAELPRPGFFRILASPIGALITRLPQNQDRARSILRQDGHGPSLDAGRIPDVFFDWHVALVRDTTTFRNERAMIRDAVVRGGAWRPGVTFKPAELATIQQPLIYVIGSADPRAQSTTRSRSWPRCPTPSWMSYLMPATCSGSTMRSTSATRSAPSSTTRPRLSPARPSSPPASTARSPGLGPER